MKYIYKINEDNYLVSHKKLQSDQPLGLIEDHQDNKYCHYDRAWISEDKLTLCNSDGSYKYQVIDNKLVLTEFDNVSFTKDALSENVKPQIRAILSEYDSKVLEYTEQKELVSKGLKDSTDLTEEEYTNILLDKEFYRKLSKQLLEYIENITTDSELADDEGLFKVDISNMETAIWVMEILNGTIKEGVE